MSMGYRSALAGVVAAVLFAVAWPVCDQLAGLSVGASSAVAGVLAIVAFGMTLRVTRSEFLRVERFHPARARPSELRWHIVSQRDVTGQVPELS
jgi:membrane associated rhomboid family serine protease